MNIIHEHEFDAVYAIMEEAFPPIERRSYEQQKNLLFRSNYKIYACRDGQDLTAFISVWEYDDFLFIEHLAIEKKHRSKGLGAALLKDIMDLYQKPILLEVELPNTDIAIRRIHFYERLGFHVNAHFSYEQPPLQQGFPFYPLLLMSYPATLSEDTLVHIKNQLYRDVYEREAAS